MNQPKVTCPRIPCEVCRILCRGVTPHCLLYGLRVCRGVEHFFVEGGIMEKILDARGILNQVRGGSPINLK